MRGWYVLIQVSDRIRDTLKLRVLHLDMRWAGQGGRKTVPGRLLWLPRLMSCRGRICLGGAVV